MTTALPNLAALLAAATPGPWKVPGTLAAVRGPRGETICSTWSCGEDDKGIPRMYGANRSLIALAPSLAAALIETAEALVEADVYLDCECESDAAQVIIRAALARVANLDTQVGADA